MLLIKVLAGFDPHLKGVNPESRIDHYPSAILLKLIEMSELAATHDVDAAVITGDLCDIPRISTSLTGQLANIIRTFPCPVYVVPGNHDLFGYSMKGIEHTTLGLLGAAGVVNILDRKELVILKDQSGMKVSLQGQEFHPEMDKRDPAIDYGVTRTGCDYDVLVVHGNLLDKPAHPDMPQTLIADLPEGGPDVILCGHWHPGIANNEVQKDNGPLVVNPGSIARKEATKDNFTRIPTVALLTFKPDGIARDYIELRCARPAEEVLDANRMVTDEAAAAVQQTFAQALMNSSFQAYDLPGLVKKLATEIALPQPLVTKALSGLVDAEVAQEDNDKLDGYIDKGYPIWISEVILENFQSHEHTSVKFVCGMNALVGESDQGKTAILRAIRWCLENEPKGNSMIRVGAKTCKVTVKFSDGSAVERERTNTKAGTWKVVNHDGTEQLFEGWKGVPIEIANTHQMPSVNLTKSNRANLNIQRQLDSAFLIGASPGDRAAIIGRLTGIHIVDAAIKETSRIILSAQRDVKSKERQLEDKQKQIKTFDDLTGIKERIELARIAIDLHTMNSKELSDLRALGQDLATVEKEINDLMAAQLQFPDYAQADSLASQAECILSELTSAEGLLFEMSRVEKDLVELEKARDCHPDYDQADLLVTEALKVVKELDELNSLYYDVSMNDASLEHYEKQKANLPDFEDLMALLEEAEQITQELSELESLNTDMKAVQGELDKLALAINKANLANRANEKEYRDALKELKVCPTCFSELDDDRIEILIGRETHGAIAS